MAFSKIRILNHMQCFRKLSTNSFVYTTNGFQRSQSQCFRKLSTNTIPVTIYSTVISTFTEHVLIETTIEVIIKSKFAYLQNDGVTVVFKMHHY